MNTPNYKAMPIYEFDDDKKSWELFTKHLLEAMRNAKLDTKSRWVLHVNPDALRELKGE